MHSSAAANKLTLAAQIQNNHCTTRRLKAFPSSIQQPFKKCKDWIWLWKKAGKISVLLPQPYDWQLHVGFLITNISLSSNIVPKYNVWSLFQKFQKLESIPIIPELEFLLKNSELLHALNLRMRFCLFHSTLVCSEPGFRTRSSIWTYFPERCRELFNFFCV